MLRVSGHQPSYIPWLGYIEKLISCDKFVVMDSVQFSRKDYIHKNYILSKDGPQCLSIPLVGGQEYRTISELEISIAKRFKSRGDWQFQHLSSIRHAYRRSPYFEEVFPLLEPFYSEVQYTRLIDISNRYLDLLCTILSIPKSRVVRMSSDLKMCGGSKDDLVLEHCLQLGASEVLFGSQGRGYVDTQKFTSRGISVIFQDFVHPVYTQSTSSDQSFVSNISFIDALMNLGPERFARLVKPI